VRHQISKPKPKNHSKHNLQWQFFKQFFVCLAEKFPKSGNITQKIVSQFFAKSRLFLHFLDNNLLWSCSLCLKESSRPMLPLKGQCHEIFASGFFA
jgi:hypothetical protein